MSALAGIILAAGRSRRMGRPKALLAIRPGQPILGALVDAFGRAGLAPTLVVAAGAALEHAETLPGITVLEGRPEAQMIDSLASAVAALPPTCAGVVVQPVDAPFTSPEMITRLVQGAGDGPRVLGHQGEPGHPVYLPRALFAAVLARPSGGLRTLLAGTAELIEWPDATVLADLDTPEDLERWR